MQSQVVLTKTYTEHGNLYILMWPDHILNSVFISGYYLYCDLRLITLRSEKWFSALGLSCNCFLSPQILGRVDTKGQLINFSGSHISNQHGEKWQAVRNVLPWNGLAYEMSFLPPSADSSGKTLIGGVS